MDSAREMGFSRLYRQLTATSVSEPAAAPAANARLREKVVRCLWFDQFLDPENLRTADGRRLMVFSPGYWNESSGPDFNNSEISFDEGPRKRGDVEIHVEASGWMAHGHADDPAYGRVILHVALENDLKQDYVRHGEREIPQLILRDHLTGDLQEILGQINAEDYPRIGCGREGTCCRSIRAAGRDERWVGRFLDIAGDERMLRKADAQAVLQGKTTPDEAMYEGLLEAMGYSANRRGFKLLAKRVPLDLLKRIVPQDGEPQEKLLHAQGVLLGAAGFLEIPTDRELDEESKEYMGKLRSIWERAREAIGGELNMTAWRLHRTRPTNHPLRRLAGVSAFIATHLHSGLCRAFMGAVEQCPSAGPEPRRCRETLERFHAILEQPAQEYWLRRTGFRKQCLPRPTALIGAARTSEIVVNVVVPLLLAISRDARPQVEQRLHNVYSSLRPHSENSVARYMKQRIFESPEMADRVVRSLRRQQGLIQIFHDYCESSSSTCEACGFLAAIERCDR